MIEEAFEFTLESSEIKRLRNIISDMVSSKKRIDQELEKAKENKKETEERNKNAIKARAFLQQVAEQTQSTLEYRISHLVSLAQASVYPDPYGFELTFAQRRNKTEADIWFTKDGVQMEPLVCSGGGPLDVASFALSCAFWGLDKRSRPVKLMDEPFKYVSQNYQAACSEMVKEVSNKLGIQIIMVSHLPEMISGADRIFKIDYEKGKSYITREK